MNWHSHSQTLKLLVDIFCRRQLIFFYFRKENQCLAPKTPPPQIKTHLLLPPKLPVELCPLGQVWRTASLNCRVAEHRLDPSLITTLFTNPRRSLVPGGPPPILQVKGNELYLKVSVDKLLFISRWYFSLTMILQEPKVYRNGAISRFYKILWLSRWVRFSQK